MGGRAGRSREPSWRPVTKAKKISAALQFGRQATLVSLIFSCFFLLRQQHISHNQHAMFHFYHKLQRYKNTNINIIF